MEPLAAILMAGAAPAKIYWFNISSAFLDNATLAAMEISPKLTQNAVTALILGLVSAGGMLIQGNIPNIVAAGRLNIKSRQWAGFAFPLGLAIMVIYFILVEVFL